MFKRVQKRQRRKEKEEELGLNEDMKEVLGLQDTDSEESESSSDEEGSGSDEQNIAEDDNEDEDDEEADASDTPEGELEDEDDASEEDDSVPPISVTEAVRDPVYLVSMDPEVKACILCTGKLLKNMKMAEIHKASKAHNRRFTKFVQLVGKAGPDGDVRDLIKIMNIEISAPAPAPAVGKDAAASSSKRALKRKEKLDVVKAKREQAKQARKRKAEKEKKKAEREKNQPAQSSSNGEATAAPAKPQSKPKLGLKGKTLPAVVEGPVKSSPEPPKKKRKVVLNEDKHTAETSPLRNIRPASKPIVAEKPKLAKPSDESTLSKDAVFPRASKTKLSGKKLKHAT